jgi:hypothetical protein
MQTEPNPAFQQGIEDPEFWANFCRTYDNPPKNALSKHAPKFSTTVSLHYKDGENTRLICSYAADSPEDATDLALMLSDVAKPGSNRVISISPLNSPASEA